MKAIILAGGKGSRLAPLTDNIPKALIPIENSTLIEKVIDSLPEVVNEVIITTKYLGELIKEKIGTERNNKAISYVEQPADMDGTWPAFYAAKEHVLESGQFLVMNCDDLFLQSEISAVIETRKNGMGVTSTTMPAKYHGILISPDNMILGLQRHPNTDREELLNDTFANGLYLLDQGVFSFPSVSIADNEHGLPQTLLKQVDTYPLFAHHMEHWQPCNSFKDLEKITSPLSPLRRI